MEGIGGPDALNGVPARYWHRLDDGRIQCDLCPRDCRLHAGQRGACFVRQRVGDGLVLESQLRAIELARVGSSIDAIHKSCVETLTEGMVKLGILQGDVATLIAEDKYKPFYMHRTSHWLGMDVHDAGAYYLAGKSRPLEAGMALTIEPGLYFSATDERVPEAYRGIGVRIEDDIVVTDKGPLNLTVGVPKVRAEVEKACAAG